MTPAVPGRKCSFETDRWVLLSVLVKKSSMQYSAAPRQVAFWVWRDLLKLLQIFTQSSFALPAVILLVDGYIVLLTSDCDVALPTVFVLFAVKIVQQASVQLMWCIIIDLLRILVLSLAYYMLLKQKSAIFVISSNNNFWSVFFIAYNIRITCRLCQSCKSHCYVCFYLYKQKKSKSSFRLSNLIISSVLSSLTPSLINPL